MLAAANAAVPWIDQAQAAALIASGDLLGGNVVMQVRNGRAVLDDRVDEGARTGGALDIGREERRPLGKTARQALLMDGPNAACLAPFEFAEAGSARFRPRPARARILTLTRQTY